MKFARIALFMAGAALVLTATACGDDDDGANGLAQPTAARPSQPTTAPTATAGAGADTLAVRAQDFGFNPAELNASTGTPFTVRLSNEGQFPHTINVFEEETFATPVEGATTGAVAPGESGEFEVTFGEAKVYHFRCAIHPAQMRGTIIVE